nr:unnamed protein product [Callosobruchus analis]
MDTCILFPKSSPWNRYVLTGVDGFSKYTYIKPVPNTYSKHVIEKLKEFFLSWETQNDYCSSKVVKLFTAAVGLPRGNGQAERTNKAILDALATSGSTTEKNN